MITRSIITDGIRAVVSHQDNQNHFRLHRFKQKFNLEGYNAYIFLRIQFWTLALSKQLLLACVRWKQPEEMRSFEWISLYSLNVFQNQLFHSILIFFSNCFRFAFRNDDRSPCNKYQGFTCDDEQTIFAIQYISES